MSRLRDIERIESYFWFFEILKNGSRYTQEELVSLWSKCSFGSSGHMSKDTFHRYLYAVEELFQVQVKCDSHYQYYIVRSERTSMYKQLISSSINYCRLGHMDKDIEKHIVFDPVKYTEPWLSACAQAFGLHRKLFLQYKRYDQSKIKEHVVTPMALRLHLNRWYLCGKNDFGSFLTFSFDRMGEIQVLDETYISDEKFDAQEYYKYAFGTMVDGFPLIKIKIKAMERVCNFLSTNPLGPDMLIAEQGEGYCIIETKMLHTRELTNNLMRMIDAIEILEPKELREELMERCARGYENQAKGLIIESPTKKGTKKNQS